MRIILIMLLVSLTACSSNKSNTMNKYLELIATEEDTQMDTRVVNFAELYNHLDHNHVATEATKTYAESFYFNDTLVTIDNREELIEYLEQTQQQVESMSLEVIKVFDKDEDVFVQWKMQTVFTIMGKRTNVKSIGISHLRFDKDGKIILHQDYWDSTNGFFQHIPVIGGLISWVKNRLH